MDPNLQQSKNSGNWSFWSLLIQASAIWNAITFLGQMLVVVSISVYSFAPAETKKNMLARMPSCWKATSKTIRKSKFRKYLPSWCPCNDPSRQRPLLKGSSTGSIYNVTHIPLQRSQSFPGSEDTDYSSGSEKYDDVAHLEHITNRQRQTLDHALHPKIEIKQSSNSSAKTCAHISRKTGKPCNKNLSKMWLPGKKHYCRHCSGWFCHDHTAFAVHGKWSSCKLKSNCVCVNCAKLLKEPLTPSSLLKLKKNKAGKFFDFNTRKILGEDD